MRQITRERWVYSDSAEVDINPKPTVILIFCPRYILIVNLQTFIFLRCRAEMQFSLILCGRNADVTVNFGVISKSVRSLYNTSRKRMVYLTRLDCWTSSLTNTTGIPRRDRHFVINMPGINSGSNFKVVLKLNLEL